MKDRESLVAGARAFLGREFESLRDARWRTEEGLTNREIDELTRPGAADDLNSYFSLVSARIRGLRHSDELLWIVDDAKMRYRKGGFMKDDNGQQEERPLAEPGRPWARILIRHAWTWARAGTESDDRTEIMILWPDVKDGLVWRGQLGVAYRQGEIAKNKGEILRILSPGEQPPRPPVPTSLGAVVRAERGGSVKNFVRIQAAFKRLWLAVGGSSTMSDADMPDAIIEVLYEGIEES